MREKIFKFANQAWTAAKSPVGLTIVGGISGSAATDIFNKSKHVQALDQAQLDCNQLEKRAAKFEDLNVDLSIRNDRLIDELRQVDRNTNVIRTQLAEYRNAWCFWKPHSGQPLEQAVFTDKTLTNSSQVKK